MARSTQIIADSEWINAGTVKTKNGTASTSETEIEFEDTSFSIRVMNTSSDLDKILKLRFEQSGDFLEIVAGQERGWSTAQYSSIFLTGSVAGVTYSINYNIANS